MTVGNLDLTLLTLSNNKVYENQPLNTIIGNLIIINADSSSNYTYSLITGKGDTDNDLFIIDNNQLQTHAIFDYESKNTFKLRVRATDEEGFSYEQRLIVKITDVNETATKITVSNNLIAENQPIGSLIGSLNSIDPDSNNTFTYSLVNGTGSEDNSLFTIENNQLKTNSIFNHEAQNSYIIRVRSFDQGRALFEKSLAIIITNVNEPPVVTNYIQPQYFSANIPFSFQFAEDTFTDPDIGDTLTYSATLADGTALPSWLSFNPSTRTLSGTSAEVSTLNITVTATDSQGLTANNNFAFNVVPDNWFNSSFTNINWIDNNLILLPISWNTITLSNDSIAENQTINTAIGSLSTFGEISFHPCDPIPDYPIYLQCPSYVPPTYTYNLISGLGDTDNDLFTIVGDQLKTNALFDYESKNSYSIRVQSYSNTGNIYEAQFTININDINETPTDITLSNNIIAENQPIGAILGTLNSTDPDLNNTFTYSLVTGTGSRDNVLFTIENNQLKTNAIFDYETKNSYTIRVRTMDQGRGIFEKQLTINVSDVLNDEDNNQDLPSSKISADFNQDGNSDFLWHNQVTGSLTVWTMEDTEKLETKTLQNSAGNNLKLANIWQAHTGDFNGDDQTEILFYNKNTGSITVWNLKNNIKVGDSKLKNSAGNVLKTNNPNSWLPIVGDLNSDGKDDLLWHNQTSGTLSVWHLNNNVKVSNTTIQNAQGKTVKLNSDWKPYIADLTGDGKNDILLHNKVSGKLTLWQMNDNQIVQKTNLQPKTELSWSLAGISDINRDGYNDLVWQDKNNGGVIYWYMKNTNLTQTQQLAYNAPSNLDLII